MSEELQEPDPSLGILGYFARRVRAFRKHKNWSQSELAKRMYTDQATISRFEKCKQLPTLAQCKALDKVFEVVDIFVDMYEPLHNTLYPAWFRPWIEMERQALSICALQTQVLPGLLQTEDYARAMLATVRPPNLDTLVAARLSRQALFEREDRPRCWFILDWPVLQRQIGGPQVMQAQLRRLLHEIEDNRTVIQVISSDRPVHAGINGAFTVMGLPNHSRVLHVDGFIKGRMSLDSDEITEADRTYDLLRGDAMSPDQSADLIRAQLQGVR